MKPVPYSQDTSPDSTRKAFAALSKFIEFELGKFSPDIVVYGPIDHSICYLMDKSAERRDIARIGIQPSFISNRFIVQSQGDNWMEHLRTADMPDLLEGRGAGVSQPNINGKFRRVPNSNNAWNLHLWIRGCESALRVLSGGTTFDTLRSLSSLIASKIASPRWFPNLKTLESLEDIKTGSVFVALNQPALTSWDSPTWTDLIALALEATPEDIVIVIRPHPSEAARELPNELERALRSRGALISRVGHGPSMAGIIQECRAVMTLTSGVGMEALLVGVPVITLCPTFYSRSGMAKTIKLSDAALVRQILVNAEQFQADEDEVNRFTEWLLNNHVVPSLQEINSTGRTLIDHIRSTLKQRNVKN